MLTLRQLTLSRGGNVLLTNASVALQEKQKIGIVGHNGCGKSTLFGLILGQLVADSGECLLNPHLQISYLSQQLPDSVELAQDFVLGGDTSYVLLQQQLNAAEKAFDDAKVLRCHEALNQTAGYSKPALAATIMAGLGFQTKDNTRSVKSFSGGWRMRLSLARCLMKPADLLLLDEPTNHLDMEAIFWLEKWLKQTASSLLLISHDREFLDACVSHILHIDQQKLVLYTGNYSRFEQTRAQQLALQQQLYSTQQEKINHLMTYVNRFRTKASKAKQAQSRLTMIARMDVIAKAQVDSPFSFEFFISSKATNPLINCDKVIAGYDLTAPILKKVNLILSAGDRIALLGPNGTGKSTLIKTLIGTLPTLSGVIYRADKLKIGYYAQHQLEALDNQLSPVQTIQCLSPDVKEQTIRDYLGSFNFVGDAAINKISHFSGGEKARLALAKLVWQKPNLLLLDEPTNHLDLTMRAAIEIALQRYNGALILISHDRHLLCTTVDDFYLVYQQQVTPFRGDLTDYYRWLAIKDSTHDNKESIGATNYRDRKSLQNKLKKLEHQLEQDQSSLQQLEIMLADITLYQSNQQTTLQSLIDKQQLIQQRLIKAEEEWLEITEKLDLIDK
jgi:ATP-binding cassette subfamily F protein 3